MGIKSTIQDGSGSDKAAKVHKKENSSGLVVYNEPLLNRRATNSFAINDSFGVNMAIDASFGGTPVLVHNGTDTVAWTGSEPVGVAVSFNNNSQAHTGSFSVRYNDCNVGDVAQYLNSSTIDLTNYTAITLWIYVSRNWSPGDSYSIYGWDSGSSTIIGDKVLLEDYFNEIDTDIWQKISIPFTDMGLTGETIDAFRTEVEAKQGNSIRFFLDDFQIEETGTPAEFVLEPPKGTVLEVYETNLNFIDVLDTTLLDNSMPNLSYDKYLGRSKLENGLLFTTTIDNETTFAGVFRCIGDSFRSGAVLENAICDGTNTHVTLKATFSHPVVLDSRKKDNLRILITDDLDGLISITFNARGATIDIPFLEDGI